ncbi:MAG: MATE family efflux transporter [Methylophilaceae bacterium]
MDTSTSTTNGSATTLVTEPLNPLLTGNLLKTLIKLALPTVLVLFMTTLLSIAETYFVSSLGVHAIAAASLVVPVMMFMTMVSNGGVGGGVSSAVARAIGAKNYVKAESLAWHAALIGAGFGLLFSIIAVIAGPSVYQFLGGSGETLDLALIYSDILFSGAISFWMVALLQSVLRGAGNVKLPAIIIFTSVIVGLLISPMLIIGWLGVPKLGIAGAGVAQILCSYLALFLLIRYMRSKDSTIKLRPHPLNKAHFKEILGIGLLSSINAVMTSLSLTLLTAAAGVFGVAAIAGFGIASRLELLLIPIMFGFGTAAITVIGTNLGAGYVKRARHAALLNAIFVALLVEMIGLFVAIFPERWISLFSTNPEVLEVGGQYLALIGPMYAFMAITTELYFAGQGAAKIGWPLSAGAIRLCFASMATWFALRFSTSMHVTFAIVASGIFIAAIVSLYGFKITPWGRYSPK